MDCRTSRGLFSEHHDRRLASESKVALERHLDSCDECGPEWVAYTQVFSLVASSEEMDGSRPFRKPSGPPGGRREVAMPGRRSFGWLNRVAAAAAVLIVTHILVFAWGHRIGGPDIGDPLPAFASGIGATRNASFETSLNEGLRDQIDGWHLLLRTIKQMPEDADEAGLELVNANVDLLQAACPRLGESDLARLNPERVKQIQRLERAADDFSTQVRRAVPHAPNAVPIAWLQQQVERSELPDAIQSLRPVVERAAQGHYFEQALKFAVRSADPVRGDVRRFMHAQTPLLVANYPLAIKRFRHFQQRDAESPLLPLAKYLEAEAEFRRQNFGRASELVKQPGVLRRFETRITDPIVMLATTSGLFQVTVRGRRVGLHSSPVQSVVERFYQMYTAFRASRGVREFEKKHSIETEVQSVGLNPPRARMQLRQGGVPLSWRSPEGRRLYQTAIFLFYYPTLTEADYDCLCAQKGFSPIEATPDPDTEEVEISLEEQKGVSPLEPDPAATWGAGR